jgi:hypothetical protein
LTGLFISQHSLCAVFLRSLRFKILAFVEWREKILKRKDGEERAKQAKKIFAYQGTRGTAGISARIASSTKFLRGPARS